MTDWCNCCGMWGPGRTFANAIAVGVGEVVGFGALIDNMGTGIAVGAAIAVAVSVAQVRKKQSWGFNLSIAARHLPKVRLFKVRRHDRS